MSTSRARVRSFLVLSAAALLAGELGAQTRKLSPPSRRGVSGSVTDVRISPDGSAVVYLEESSSHEEAVNTFFVVTDAETRLIARVGPGKVGPFAVSPDKRFLVYLQARPHVYGSALFGVPLDGSSAPRRLSPPPELLPAVGPSFQISAQGLVVFEGRRGGDIDALYTAALTGRQPATRLDAQELEGGRVSSFALSPDGRWVAYSANQEDLARYELFLAPITGAVPARKLNGPLIAPEFIGTFRFAPSSERVVFLAGRIGPDELYSAPVYEAAPPVELSADGVGPSEVSFSFEVSPDGNSVVYIHDATSSQRQLFRAPIKGGAAPTRLNAPLVTGGHVLDLAIARDGSVVYLADQEVNNQDELFHVSAKGAVRKLNNALGERQDVSFFQLAPDGNRVVYSTDRPQRTFLTTLDGSIGPVVLPGAPSGPGERPFTFDSSGERLVFLVDGGLFSLLLDGVSVPLELLHAEPGFRADSVGLELPGARLVVWVFTGLAHELFTVPIAGGAAPQKISAPLPMEYALDDVWSVELSADGRWAVFGFGPYYDQRLYSVDLLRRSDPVQLADEALSRSGIVPWFQISPDGTRVVFRSGEQGLFSVPIDGSAPPIFLDTVLTTDEIRLTPDGRAVLYLDAERRLRSAALDGTSAPALLGGFPEQGSVLFHGYRISPDGARVVYHFEVAGESEVRLLSAPSDGSGAPVQLDPTHGTELLIDIGAGDRVVFETLAAGGVTLWSVPADGSAAPVPLATANIYQSPDHDGIEVAGDRVLFLATFGNLFSVPIDGHEAPRPLAPGFGAGLLEVSGARATFVAGFGSGFQDLFSVPVDGSAAPVRLSRASSFGSSIAARRVSADGTRVAYLHDQAGGRALYSTAYDGSTEPVRLSAPLSGEEQQLPADFELSADGRTVAFEVETSDFSADTTASEVFVSPSDGHRAPQRVNEPPFGGSYVLDFRLDAGGRSVLFVADQEERNVYELFLATLRTPGRVLRR